MAQFEIKDVRFGETDQFYPFIEMTIDGRKIRTGSEQKALAEFGFAFMGDKNADMFPILVIPKGAKGRTQDTEIEGFTDDPDIVKLVRYFVDQVRENTFETGRVDLGKLFP